jgi:hypothetical protein
MWISHLDGRLAPRPPPLHLLSFFETPAVTLQGGAKRKSGEASKDSVLLRALRSDGQNREIRSTRFPKGSAQKQQTHLNHAVLIPPRNRSSIFAAGDTICAVAGTSVVACSQADQHPSFSGGCSNDPSLRSTSASRRTARRTNPFIDHHP